MSFAITLETTSPEDTRALGVRVGRALPDRALVFLEGGLGAGKTLFTKGLYEGYGGMDASNVVSPTYTMVNVYEDARRPVYHVDLYRLERREQLLAMEYEDFLLENDGLTVVEWPAFARTLVNADEVLDVHIEAGADDDRRRMTVRATGGRYDAVRAALAAL